METLPGNPSNPKPTVIHYLKWMRVKDGGIFRAVVDLADLLTRSGTTVYLLTCDDSDVPKDWPRVTIGQPIPVSNLPVCILLPLSNPLAQLQGKSPNDSDRDTPTQIFSRATLGKVRAMLGSVPNPVLHLHGPWATSNAQLSRICKSLRVPYIISPHGMLDDWCMHISGLRKKLHLALVSRSMLQHAAAVHFTAQAEREQSLRTIYQTPTPPQSRSAVIPLPIDLSGFLAPVTESTSPARGRKDHPVLSDDSALRIVFLSRLHEKKGVERLLRAIALARAEGANCRAVIAGPAHTPEYRTALEHLATELGIAQHVSFPGMVTGDAKTALYRAAHVFALPTSQENFGIVLVEAMACGVPVITTKGVDIWPELLASGAAIICNSDPTIQIREVADAIVSLERNPDRRDSMGSAARAWANEALNTSTIISQFQTMYGRALSAR